MSIKMLIKIQIKIQIKMGMNVPIMDAFNTNGPHEFLMYPAPGLSTVETQ